MGRRSPFVDPFGDTGVEFGDGDRAVVPQVGLAVYPSFSPRSAQAMKFGHGEVGYGQAQIASL